MFQAGKSIIYRLPLFNLNTVSLWGIRAETNAGSLIGRVEQPCEFRSLATVIGMSNRHRMYLKALEHWTCNDVLMDITKSASFRLVNDHCCSGERLGFTESQRVVIPAVRQPVCLGALLETHVR